MAHYADERKAPPLLLLEAEEPPWQRVVYLSECVEEGDFGEVRLCPACGLDYSECPCPGPTMEGYDYIEHEGTLYARLSRPYYNHTREDSDLYPCDICKASQALWSAYTKPPLTVRELMKRSSELNRQKGWYDLWPDGSIMRHRINVVEQLALIHTELSEALQEFRKKGDVRLRVSEDTVLLSVGDEIDGFVEMWSESGKPEGFVVELADAFIRIASLCGALGLDLEKAVERKHTYNQTRTFRHGGKRL
jgi:hypothetical protein